MKVDEADFEALEEHQVLASNMNNSRYVGTFGDQIPTWVDHLSKINEVTSLLGEIQRVWAYLEKLFIWSEEVKKELKEPSEKFKLIHEEVKTILKDGVKTVKILDFCIKPGLEKRLQKVQAELEVCENALMEFVDKKKKTFPRFYFVASDELLFMLSNGNSPKLIIPMINLCFQTIDKIT